MDSCEQGKRMGNKGRTDSCRAQLVHSEQRDLSVTGQCALLFRNPPTIPHPLLTGTPQGWQDQLQLTEDTKFEDGRLLVGAHAAFSMRCCLWHIQKTIPEKTNNTGQRRLVFSLSFCLEAEAM